MHYSDKEKVVFFDSECVLCGNFLKILLRLDKRKVLNFASLQSDYSKERLPEEFVQTADYKSVAFHSEGHYHFYSDAVIKAISSLGFPWQVIKLAYVIPKKWRDGWYMKVSKNRYSWFGKSDQCILPDESLRLRFMHELSI